MPFVSRDRPIAVGIDGPERVALAVPAGPFSFLPGQLAIMVCVQCLEHGGRGMPLVTAHASVAGGGKAAEAILAILVDCRVAGEFGERQHAIAIAVNAREQIARGVPFEAAQTAVAVVIQTTEALRGPVVDLVDGVVRIVVLNRRCASAARADFIACQSAVAVPVVVAERAIASAPFLACDDSV